MSLQCPSKNQPENGKYADARGTLQRKAEHKEKPASPDISRGYELLKSSAGGGTRTHTMSPSTDFESASSANSNTPANNEHYHTTSKSLCQHLSQKMQHFLNFKFFPSRDFSNDKKYCIISTNTKCSAQVLSHCG